MRVPLSSGLEGKIFIPIPGIDELSANSSGAEKTLGISEVHLIPGAG